MEIIYTVVFNGSELRDGKFYDVRVPVANFFDSAYAGEFAQAENDEVQADIMEIEQTPLVGLDGDLIRAQDFPAIFGRLIGA